MEELLNDPEKLQVYMDLILPFATSLLLAVFILALAWLVSKWMGRMVTSVAGRKLDVAVGRFLGTITQYAVLVAGIISALARVGVETTSVVAIFASAGLAVGLALQGSLSNFASGVMILIFRPFHIDDVVTVAGHTGGVKDIGLFATTLVTPDNQKVIVPNSAITGGSIVNITTLGTRRMSVDVGVAYGSDLQKLDQVVLEATGGCPLVLAEPAPAFIFTEMAASSINFKVLYWTKSADAVGSGPQVRSAVYLALLANGIEIPFDQLVLHKAS